MNAEFNINGIKIETERLILRAFEESDLDDFYEYASVDGIGEMAGWKHHANKGESKEKLDSFIKKDKTFAICLKSDNKVIGSLGIEKYVAEDKLTEFLGYKGREIGYVLSKAYWGMGIMPEAVKAIINYLFNDLNFDFLLCGYYAFNAQSKRVQEKCGFKPYRKVEIETSLGTKESGIITLLINPNTSLILDFSHLETLIYSDGLK